MQMDTAVPGQGGQFPSVFPLTVAESLSQELVFLCEAMEPASPGTGGISFQAEGAADAKALGQKAAHSRPLWLEKKSRVGSGWKQSHRGQQGSLVESCGVGSYGVVQEA